MGGIIEGAAALIGSVVGSGAAAGTAAAVGGGLADAALTGEVITTAAAPALFGAADVAGLAGAGLGAAGAAGAFGGGGAAAGAADSALSPSAFSNAINAPSPANAALKPASFTPSPGGNLGSPTGGPGASPASTAAPASVPAVSPDVSAAFGQSGVPNLTGGFDAATQGAATGTGPLNTGAVGVGNGAGATSNTIEAAFNNPTGGNILKALGANASPLIAGAGLGADLLKGNQTPPGYSNILGTANQLSGQANQLESYLGTGTLPPGIQQSIHSATESAKASIRSQYASRGMSGSSAEAQDLANADTVASTQGANIASQLLSQGINENQLATSLYSTIMNEALTSDAQLSSAIGQFAAAAAGGAGGANTITLKTA